MSNRRNMGGNQGYTNRLPAPSFRSHVNPWSNPVGTMNQGGGLLSQLSTNPHQLALALSTILQPQNPQPLMAGYNSVNFSDRFGRGRDQHRLEPYTKAHDNFVSWSNNRNFNQSINKNRIQKDDRKKIDKNRGSIGNRNRNQGGNKKSNQKKDDKKDNKDKDADQSMDEEEKKTVKDEEDGDETEEKADEKKKEGKFFDIPACYLTCFVCNKQMWDGVSMEKHLRGLAHSEMIKALEDSIGVTVGILHENMRLVEERNVIEAFRLQRIKRLNKFRGPEERCNMCDLSFRGKMSVHRRSEGHQRLKRYLHPKCQICDIEFHSRIEWIEHRLTPEHLRAHCENIEENPETSTSGKDGSKIITNIDEQDSEEVDLDKLLIEPLQMDNEDVVTELDENLDNVQNRFPAYKTSRALSTKSLVEFTGFKCELCNRSFTNEKDGKAHLKTAKHYYKFIRALKRKWDQKEKKERQEREKAGKQQKEEEETAQENGNEEADEDNEGDVKEELDSTLEDLQISQESDEFFEEAKEEINVEKVGVIGQPPPSAAKKATTAAKKIIATVNSPVPASTKAIRKTRK